MNIPIFSRMRRSTLRRRGFTLIEILVVIGMLAILSTIVLVAVNPLRQFAQARNTERQNDVAVILNGISERIADNGGSFTNASDSATCPQDIPGTLSDIGNGGSDQFDLRPCLVSSYISELPKDPGNGINTCTTSTCASTGESYNLQYLVKEDPVTKRVTVCAPNSAEAAIPQSTQFCLTR